MADFVRVPETDWQNILDATRAKTGGTEKMVSGVVADAITGIATATITEEWQRPSNWPDPTTLGIPEPGIAYLTYDCRSTIDRSAPGYMAINGSAKTKVHRGRIENNTFVEVSEIPVSSGNKFGEWLPADEGDFVVYRVDNINGGTWGLTSNIDTNSIYSTQPCVEIYGSANGNAGSFTVWNSYTGMSIYIKSFILYGNVFNGSWTGANYSPYLSVEHINPEDWTFRNDTIDKYFMYNTMDVKSFALPCNVTCTSLQGAFCNNFALERLDLSKLDTSECTSMQMMFSGCHRLKTLDLSHFVTTKVTNFSNMFQNCGNLHTVDFSGLDTSACTATTLTMFSVCSSLVNLRVGKITVSFKFDSCGNLSHESLLNIIEALEPTEVTKTLTLGSKNLARLTADEIAVATEKGWTVV